MGRVEFVMEEHNKMLHKLALLGKARPNPIKEFLRHVNPLDLKNKINKFRNLDIERMSYEEIQSAIEDVISFPTPYGEHGTGIMPISTSLFQIGTKFYRVRPIPEGDQNIAPPSMRLVSDCWAPPANIVKIGRLNKKEESMLYVARDSLVAIEELSISHKETFSLIVYESVKQVDTIVIGDRSHSFDGLTKDECLVYEMIQDFIKSEFTRDVKAGEEYLYRISEIIAKDYFDLPPCIQDAWCYPSIANKKGDNVCFRQEKQSILRLMGVRIICLHSTPNGYCLETKRIAIDSGDGINLNYHSIGSKKQKEVFPEIGRDGLFP